MVNRVRCVKRTKDGWQGMKGMQRNDTEIIGNEECRVQGSEFNYIATAAKYNLSYLDLSKRNIPPLVGNVIIHYEHTGEALEDDREYSLMEATMMLTGVKQDDTPMYGSYGGE